MTLDAEDHTTTDSTLEILAELRKDFPDTGRCCRRTCGVPRADCRELATAGSRVRLCKGAYAEPESVAFQSRAGRRQVVRALPEHPDVRRGYPMVATHDPRLIAIAEDRARWFDRSPRSTSSRCSTAMRPEEQARLAAARQHRPRLRPVRRRQWYGYLMRRLAERPRNVAFLARARGLP